jgi:hypothetical protein
LSSATGPASISALRSLRIAETAHPLETNLFTMGIDRWTTIAAN